jgi:hypothetical protein
VNNNTVPHQAVRELHKQGRPTLHRQTRTDEDDTERQHGVANKKTDKAEVEKARGEADGAETKDITNKAQADSDRKPPGNPAEDGTVAGQVRTERTTDVLRWDSADVDECTHTAVARGEFPLVDNTTRLNGDKGGRGWGIGSSSWGEGENSWSRKEYSRDEREYNREMGDNSRGVGSSNWSKKDCRWTTTLWKAKNSRETKQKNKTHWKNRGARWEQSNNHQTNTKNKTKKQHKKKQKRRREKKEKNNKKLHIQNKKRNNKVFLNTTHNKEKYNTNIQGNTKSITYHICLNKTK